MIDASVKYSNDIPPLTTEDVDILLRDLEGRSLLLNYQVDNWCVWPIMRFPIAMRLLNLPWTQITQEEKFSWIERFSILVNDLINLRIHKSDYVILTSSSGQVDQINHKYLDIYFDDLLSHLSSYFKIEHLNNKLYLKKINELVHPRNLTTNTPYMLAGILAKTGYPKISKVISLDIAKILEIELHLSISPKLIDKWIKTFFWRKQIYKLLLSKLHPGFLLLINAYNNHAIVAAAKERNIQVIEFQHGLISNHHPGYSWDHRVLSHKICMPIPDKIFLYGEYWKEETISNGFWEDALVSTGSLRMDRYRNLSVQNIGSQICNLLVTTQGLDVKNVSQFLADFIGCAKNKIKVNLTIKLHPREHNSIIYQQELDGLENIKIIDGSSLPSTFDLLLNSDIHASISSTCHYESLALGKPTIILPFSSHEKVLQLEETGYAFKVESPDQMVECVIDNFQKFVPSEVSGKFFTPDALNNILINLSDG